MSNNRTVSVYQPSGELAYLATMPEADELLAKKQAFAMRGRDRALRGVRLKNAIPERVATSAVMPPPDPRKWFWWKKAVYPDMRPSPHRLRPSGRKAALEYDRKLKEAEKQAAEASRGVYHAEGSKGATVRRPESRHAK